MDAETISKNRASPKSHTNRRNLMKKIFAFTLVLLGMFFIYSCTTGYSQPVTSGTIDKNLIGVWENQEMRQRLVFFDNGTCLMGYTNGSSGNGGIYSIYDNILMMSSNDGGNTGERGELFTFKISGGNLELTEYGSNQPRIYKKIK